MAVDKKKMPKEWAEGYRDGVNAVWDEVLKMASKGYTPQEFQIMIKSRRYGMLKEVDEQLGPAPGEHEKGASRDATEIQPGHSYLVKEERPEGGFALFKYALSMGMKGMCIARTSPDIVRQKYGQVDAKMVWLVSSEQCQSEGLPPSAMGLGQECAPGEGTVGPDKLPWMFSMLNNFMDANNGGVVLLEGVEYLVTHNSFQGVLKFIQNLNEANSRTKCCLIITASPTAMEKKDFSLLEREMSETVEM